MWLETCQKSEIKQPKRANCHSLVSRVVNIAVFSETQSKSSGDRSVGSPGGEAGVRTADE